MMENNVTSQLSRKLNETKNLRKKSTDLNFSLTKKAKTTSPLRLVFETSAVTNLLHKSRVTLNLSAVIITTIDVAFPKTEFRSVRKNRTIMTRIWMPAIEIEILISLSRYKLHKPLAMTLIRFKFRWSIG